MNLLVIGKGGREHALVWKLAQSPRSETVFCAPGNAGTAIEGVNVPLEPHEFDKLIRFAKKNAVGLTVVGPEGPLAQEECRARARCLAGGSAHARDRRCVSSRRSAHLRAVQGSGPNRRQQSV